MTAPVTHLPEAEGQDLEDRLLANLLGAAVVAALTVAIGVEVLRANSGAGFELGVAPPTFGRALWAAAIGAGFGQVVWARPSGGRWRALAGAVLVAASVLMALYAFEIYVSRRRAVLVAAGAALASLLWAVTRAMDAPDQRPSRASAVLGGPGATRIALLAAAGLGLVIGVIRANQPLVPLVLRTEDPGLDRPPAPRGAKSIVLITLDTTRKDALGCYGGPAAATPHIDRFAEGATMFTRAVATASHTHPSMASILTGELQQQHGSISASPFLSREVTTLAEHCYANGYDTAGFLDNPWLYGGYGLQRGYAHLESRAELDSIGRWLDRRSDRPFLLHVHLFHPHGPYELRREGAAALGIDTTSAAARAVGIVISPETIRRGEIPTGHDFGADEIAWLHDVYMTEVHAMDAWVGEFFELLRKHCRLDSSVVAIVSDHGEEFGERGGLHHSHTLFGELTDVPMLVRGPWAGASGNPVVSSKTAPGGTTHDALISTAELPRLLLRHAALPPKPTERVSVEVSEGPAVALSFRVRQAGRHLMLVRHGERALHIRLNPVTGTRGVALFDLIQDPGELRDISAGHLGEIVALLARTDVARAFEWLRNVPIRPIEEAPVEPRMARRALDALGYSANESSWR